MVDAPVSGAQWGAQAAELVFMVGGAAADLARVRPLLDAMGRAVHHVGPLGAGHTMKCINNMITAMTFIATAEGLAIGKRAGLDPVAMNEVLNDSTGASWLTRNHFAQRVFSRTFDDPFKLDLMAKDVGIAMGLAQEHGLPLPLSAVGTAALPGGVARGRTRPQRQRDGALDRAADRHRAVARGSGLSRQAGVSRSSPPSP